MCQETFDCHDIRVTGDGSRRIQLTALRHLKRYLSHELILAVLSICCLGCHGSSSQSSPDEGVSIHGIVRLDGIPLTHTSVLFLPYGGVKSQAEGATGNTDESGRYDLQTLRDGVLTNTVSPGRYRVVVSRLVTSSGGPYVPDPNNPPDAIGAMESLPARYSDHALTELSAEVSGDATQIDFDLVSSLPGRIPAFRD